MQEFDITDLDKSIDEEVREVIGKLIMTWARLDSLLSQWVIVEFGMTLDSGSILLGNMDTRTKLDRLKQLYEHHGDKRSAKAVANLSKLHASHIDIRNTVAHTQCGGRRKSEPDILVFAPVKPSKGMPGTALVEQIRLRGIARATEYADQAGDKLAVITNALVSLPPTRRSGHPEFPTFPDPSPPRKRENRHRQRHQARGR